MQGLYAVISQGGDDGHLPLYCVGVWHLQIWGSVSVAASRAGGGGPRTRAALSRPQFPFGM
jgi:hypothetical protein